MYGKQKEFSMEFSMEFGFICHLQKVRVMLLTHDVAYSRCQPGAESEEAIRVGKEKGVHVIHDACILVAGDRMAKLAGKL